MNKLSQLARKFELKLALGASSSEAEDKLIPAKEKLANIIEQMSALIANSKWFEPYIQSNGNPFAEGTLNQNAKLGVFYLNKIWQPLFSINKKIDKKNVESVSIKEMMEALNIAKYSLIELANSKGTDFINKRKNKYLYLFDIYFCTEYKPAVTALVNSMSEKDDVNAPVAGFTKFLERLAEFYQGRNGVDSVYMNLISKNFFTLDQINNIAQSAVDKVSAELDTDKKPSLEGDISQVSREAEPLPVHFQRRFVIDFRKHLGFDLLGVEEEDSAGRWRYVWNNYIEPLNLVDEARKINKGSYDAPEITKPLSSYPDDRIIYLNRKYKQIPATTYNRIQEFRKKIVNRIAELSQETTTSERVLGDVASRELLGEEMLPLSPEQAFVRKKSIEEISSDIASLRGEGTDLWNLIPLNVQVAIRNGKVDLEAALQVANLNKDQVKAKQRLDKSFFEPLYTSTEISTKMPSIVEPIPEQVSTKVQITDEELSDKANSILKELIVLYRSGGTDKTQRESTLEVMRGILQRLKRFSEGKEDIKSSEMASLYPNYGVGDFKRLIKEVKSQSNNFGEAFGEEVFSALQ